VRASPDQRDRHLAPGGVGHLVHGDADLEAGRQVAGDLRDQCRLVEQPLLPIRQTQDLPAVAGPDDEVAATDHHRAHVLGELHQLAAFVQVARGLEVQLW